MAQFAIKQLLEIIGNGFLMGDENHILNDITNFELIQQNTCSDKLMWVSDASFEKYKNKIYPQIGLLILSQKNLDALSIKPQNSLIVENPKLAFQKIVEAFFTKQWQPRVESTAIIYPSVKTPESCYIGHFVVLEEGVSIGENCFIGHHTVIHAHSKIGNNVMIGSHNTIGGAGFGYAKEETGEYKQLPHIGNVVIENNVTIHNNTCIDRAVIGSTLIAEHAKIDNLVHIAHGVSIGKNTLVIANAMIAGSTKIGDNCWVAPSASILNKLAIGNDSTIGMGAVVIKDVVQKTTVVGNPAKAI